MFHTDAVQNEHSDMVPRCPTIILFYIQSSQWLLPLFKFHSSSMEWLIHRVEIVEITDKLYASCLTQMHQKLVLVWSRFKIFHGQAESSGLVFGHIPPGC